MIKITVITVIILKSQFRQITYKLETKHEIFLFLHKAKNTSN